MTDVSDRVQALREGVVTDLFRVHILEESVEEQWDAAGLEKALAYVIGEARSEVDKRDSE